MKNQSTEKLHVSFVLVTEKNQKKRQKMGKSLSFTINQPKSIEMKTLTVFFWLLLLLSRFIFANEKFFVAQTNFLLLSMSPSYPQKYFSNIYMLKSLRYFDVWSWTWDKQFKMLFLLKNEMSMCDKELKKDIFRRFCVYMHNTLMPMFGRFLRLGKKFLETIFECFCHCHFWIDSHVQENIYYYYYFEETNHEHMRLEEDVTGMHEIQ